MLNICKQKQKDIGIAIQFFSDNVSIFHFSF